MMIVLLLFLQKQNLDYIRQYPINGRTVSSVEVEDPKTI